ncbi:MAG: phosphoribosylglycinamide formyltransferase [Polyangiaceae bacterium]
MIKLGVLISGSGTNLQAILDSIEKKTLDAQVAVVISNKAEAAGLERAKKAAVPTHVIDHKKFADRPSFDSAVVDVLRDHKVDWVVLAGFMRIVTPTLLDSFPHRVVNIHPSLLPAFPGAHPHRDALAYGVKISGCTVHLVDAGTDTGPILAQAVVPVTADDDEASLAQKILYVEHQLLPRVLQQASEGKISVEKDENGGRARVRIRG